MYNICGGKNKKGGEKVKEEKTKEDEFSEFIKEEKTDYIVTVKYNQENNVVKYIKIEKQFLPLYPEAGNYVSDIWEIFNDGDGFTVRTYELRMSWGGTGSSEPIILQYQGDYGQWWLFDAEELIYDLRNKDIREVIKDIFKSILEYFSEALALEQEMSAVGITQS
jgi:hypothetical protein